MANRFVFSAIFLVALGTPAWGSLDPVQQDRGAACRAPFALAVAAGTRTLSSSELASMGGCPIAEIRYLRTATAKALSGFTDHAPLDLSGRAVSVFTAANELYLAIRDKVGRTQSWYTDFWARNGVYGVYASKILLGHQLEPQFTTVLRTNNAIGWVERCGPICEYTAEVLQEPSGLQQRVDHILSLPPSKSKIKVVRLVALGQPALDAAVQKLTSSTHGWSAELLDWNRHAIYWALWAFGDRRYPAIDKTLLSTKAARSLRYRTRPGPFQPGLIDLSYTPEALFYAGIPHANRPHP